MLNLTNKHCMITGGSDGLGLSLARLLARRGANLTILARRKTVLEEAIANIQSCATPEQRVLGMPVDCTDERAANVAIDCAISRQDGKAPYLLVCCVGSAHPKLFMEHEPIDFENEMRTNYLSTVYAIRAVLPKILLAENEKTLSSAPQAKNTNGKNKNRNCSAHVVLVSSVAGLLGFGGYSAYSPAKAALKALADCLRHELCSTGVQIHVFLPASFNSPGYVNEMKSKPEITRLVEANDKVLSSDECAEILLNGINHGQFLITTSCTGELIRCAGLVHSPPNSLIIDFFKLIIAFIVLNFWRFSELDPIVHRLNQQNKQQKKVESSISTKLLLAKENSDKEDKFDEKKMV